MTTVEGKSYLTTRLSVDGGGRLAEWLNAS